MARLASRDRYDDEDYLGNITDGIKTGIGIAQAYHNIEGAKANKAFSEAQLKDLNRAEASRNAGYDASEAESKKKRALSESEYKTLTGTAASRLVSEAIRAKDPNDGIKMIEQNLKNVSDGNLDAKFKPIVGPDGTSGGYAVDVTTKNGRQTINVGSLQEFGGMLEKERKNAGFFTIGERDAIKRIETAQQLWDGLGEDRQSKYGSYDAFLKNPEVLDHIDLMVSKDLSGAEARRTTKTWGQGDEEHGWKGESHRQQMVTEGMRQGSLGLDMQRTRQGMGFDAENQRYQVEVARKYDERLKNAQLQNDEAAFYSTLSEAIEVRFPELQPTYVSETTTDSVDGLAGLGVNAGTQKKQYSDEQLAKKKYIIQIHDTLPQNMPLEQKWEVIDAKLAEKPKPEPEPESDQGDDGDNNRGKKVVRPHKSSNDATPSSNKKPVPQPLNGALGVMPPTANELAADTARTNKSGEALSSGLRVITEGQHTRDQRRRDEEWRRRNGR